MSRVNVSCRPATVSVKHFFCFCERVVGKVLLATSCDEVRP